MTDRSSPEFSLFGDLILSRRFDYRTLQVLESAMASKDVKSLSLSRSSLKSVLRSESVSAVQLFRHESLEKQLSVLEFFVRAFSLASDVESCLVMRYEALVLRELKSATCPWAQVSPDEWLTFAAQSLDNGFFTNAVKGCDYALSCLKKKDDENPSMIKKVVDNVEITRKVKKLRDVAISSASSGSVQAQAADYMRKKTQNNNIRKRQLPQHHTETQPLASTLFQNAIKKRHTLDSLLDLFKLLFKAYLVSFRVMNPTGLMALAHSLPFLQDSPVLDFQRTSFATLTLISQVGKRMQNVIMSFPELSHLENHGV
ncbi:unnamed protein product [Rhodiola kirilowii]